MPTTRTIRIGSSPDPANPRPWFRMAADPAALAVDLLEANGIKAFSEREVAAGRLPPQAVTAQKQSAARRRHDLALSTDPALAGEVHVLAQTVTGDIEFVPASAQAPTYYAHLGWYDPATDEWTLLDFVDDTGGG